MSRRKLRVKFSDAEWAEVQKRAQHADVSGGTWVRRQCGLDKPDLLSKVRPGWLPAGVQARKGARDSVQICWRSWQFGEDGLPVLDASGKRVCVQRSVTVQSEGQAREAAMLAGVETFADRVRHKGLSVGVVRDGDGFVYAIQEATSPFRVKVGWSGDPQKRLRSVRTNSAGGADLIFAAPGSVNDESALHVLMAPDRLRGEWFTATTRVQTVLTLYSEAGWLKPLTRPSCG